MHVLDQVRLVVYRCHEKGLEVFLVNDENELPSHLIDLGMIEGEDGQSLRTIAVEGDYHDIPSLRKLLTEDIEMVSSKVKYVLDKGAFFAIKETFKKVLPNEYKVLHDLKDILMDRNAVLNI